MFSKLTIPYFLKRKQKHYLIKKKAITLKQRKLISKWTMSLYTIKTGYLYFHSKITISRFNMAERS